MASPTLTRISFGAARALTRDGFFGPYLEMLIIPSRTPVD
jgi:hypothetical protein